MEPDPIRQAFEAWYLDKYAPPRGRAALTEDHAACWWLIWNDSAKWAARALYERIQREIDLSVVIAPTTLHEIRKHFGVED